MGYDTDMVAQIVNNKRLGDILKILEWQIVEIMRSKHLGDLRQFPSKIQDAISKESDPRHYIATIVCNHFRGVTTNTEARIKLAEISELLVPSASDYGSITKHVGDAIPYVVWAYIRISDLNFLTDRSKNEQADLILKWMSSEANGRSHGSIPILQGRVQRRQRRSH